MNNFKIEIKDFKVIENKLEKIKLSLPFGLFEFEVDFSDVTIRERSLELLDLYNNREKYFNLGKDLKIENFESEQEFTEATRKVTEEIKDILHKLKNTLDYVYGVDICKDIYKHINPLDLVIYQGSKTYFSMLIFGEVTKQFNDLQSAEALKQTKSSMKEFVSKNA